MARSERKVRRCRICKGFLPPINLELCEHCRQAGMSVPKKKRMIEAQELLSVAKLRQKRSLDLLQEMNMEQINELARLYKPPYSTYGRFREYVRRTGMLPPKEYLRG